MSDVGILIVIRGIISICCIAAGYFIFHHGRKSIKDHFANPDTTAFSLLLRKATFTGRSGSILGTLFVGVSVFAIAGAYLAPTSFKTDGRNFDLASIIGSISVPVATIGLSKDPNENTNVIKETLIDELKKRGYSLHKGDGTDATSSASGPRITSIRVKNELTHEGKVPVSIEVKTGKSVYNGQYNATMVDDNLIFQPSVSPVKSNE